jgi:hypothetical protein
MLIGRKLSKARTTAHLTVLTFMTLVEHRQTRLADHARVSGTIGMISMHANPVLLRENVVMEDMRSGQALTGEEGSISSQFKPVCDYVCKPSLVTRLDVV